MRTRTLTPGNATLSRKKLYILAAQLSALLLLSACGTTQKPLYSWYDTENAAYKYTKRQTDKDLTKAMEQYKLVISKQKGSRGVVPPGVNAEYGYLLVKAGKKEEGLTLLKAEMDAYPESKTFISRIVKQLEK